MKKTVFALVMLSLAGSACNHAPENQASRNPVVAETAATPPASAPAQPEPEIMTPVILVNDQVLPLESSVAELTKRLGKPNKIETGTIECGGYFDTPKNDPSEAVVYLYGASDFEVYGQRVAMQTVDFRDGKFKAKLDGTLVDGTTTLAQIRRLYPQAAQSGGNHPTRTEAFWTIGLRAGKNSDDSWTLKFIDGKLAQLEYYIPC